HGHVAAAGGLPGGDDGNELVEPAVDLGHVHRIAGAHADARDPGEPCGQAAVVPFGADVGAGAHDRVQPDLAGGVQEVAQVRDPGEVEAAAAAFVQVPGHVGLHRIDPHGRQGLQSAPPLLG